MITKIQKEAICNTLGKHYSSKIIAHLELKGIKPLKNKVFNPKIIQDIVNGRIDCYGNVEIEIVKLVNATKKQKEKSSQKLQNLL